MTAVTSEQLKAQAEKMLAKAKDLEIKERHERNRKEGVAAFLRGYEMMKARKVDASVLFPCPSSIGLPYNQATALRSVRGIATLDKLSVDLLGAVRFWDIVTDAVAHGQFDHGSTDALRLAEKIYASGFDDYLSVMISRFPKN